jgi:PIN domain nuclease of toxin-antitoxin system
MTYILDACALIALLNEELGKGYETVRDLLDRAVTGEITLCMSLVNLVEVHYRIIQLKGIQTADAVMEPVKSLPIRFIRDITDQIYFDTARCKASYPMSLGDAFLCGTAKSLDAVIVTKDKDIKHAEEAESLSVLWI